MVWRSFKKKKAGYHRRICPLKTLCFICSRCTEYDNEDIADIIGKYGRKWELQQKHNSAQCSTTAAKPLCATETITWNLHWKCFSVLSNSARSALRVSILLVKMPHSCGQDMVPFLFCCGHWECIPWCLSSQFSPSILFGVLWCSSWQHWGADNRNSWSC